MLIAVCSALLIVPSSAFAQPQSPSIPSFWDARERIQRPDLSGLTRLRFLTTVDFPPFNMLDDGGRLVGFHVDLARAICDELGLAAICQIQALPWDELQDALAAGDGEALIAGLAVTAELREDLAFTRPYLQLPARFLVRNTNPPTEPMWRALDGQRVGVIARSRHEAMLRALFPGIRPVAFSQPDLMMTALRNSDVEAVFGDGLGLSLQLAGEDLAQCCTFAGGPYLSQEHLGVGLAIAVSGDNGSLVAAFDHALREIDIDGRFAELYLRHFPVGFY